MTTKISAFALLLYAALFSGLAASPETNKKQDMCLPASGQMLPLAKQLAVNVQVSTMTNPVLNCANLAGLAGLSLWLPYNTLSNMAEVSSILSGDPRAKVKVEFEAMRQLECLQKLYLSTRLQFVQELGTNRLDPKNIKEFIAGELGNLPEDDKGRDKANVFDSAVLRVVIPGGVLKKVLAEGKGEEWATGVVFFGKWMRLSLEGICLVRFDVMLESEQNTSRCMLKVQESNHSIFAFEAAFEFLDHSPGNVCRGVDDAKRFGKLAEACIWEVAKSVSLF